MSLSQKMPGQRTLCRMMLGCATLAVAALSFVPQSWALTPDEAAALPDRALGKADAPVTIIEYASMTCGACARFQNTIMPQLKEKYIETGKVKLIYRDYPLDGAALKVAAIARCMPENSYHAYITLLFKNQMDWVGSDPTTAVAQYARLGGLSQADAEACAKSDKLMDAISEGRLQADKLYKIGVTPTFILNGGKDRVDGVVPFEEFSAKIDALLAATAAPEVKPETKTEAAAPAPEEKAKTETKK